jgi:hypothetical protein
VPVVNNSVGVNAVAHQQRLPPLVLCQRPILHFQLGSCSMAGVWAVPVVTLVLASLLEGQICQQFAFAPEAHFNSWSGAHSRCC